METRLYVAYLARGELADYYYHLIDDLYNKYKLVELKEKRRLPHVTIKAPFSAEDISGVEKLVESLTKREERIFLDVSGIGQFEDNVIYMGVNTGQEGRDYIGKVIGEFRGGGFEMSRFDIPDKRLHITFAKKKECGGRFEDVSAYLLENRKDFRVPLDNLTIMGKNRGKSGIYRFFPIY